MTPLTVVAGQERQDFASLLDAEVSELAQAIRRLAKDDWRHGGYGNKVTTRIGDETRGLIRQFAREEDLSYRVAARLLAADVQNTLKLSGRSDDQQPQVQFRSGWFGSYFDVTRL